MLEKLLSIEFRFTARIYIYKVLHLTFFSTSAYFVNGNTQLMSDLTDNQFYPSAERIWLCLRFAKWACDLLAADADFGRFWQKKKIIFSDEAHFDRQNDDKSSNLAAMGKAPRKQVKTTATFLNDHRVFFYLLITIQLQIIF